MNLALGTVRLPTTRADWRLLVRTSRLVLTLPRYALVAVVAAAVALSVFVLTQNVTLVLDVVVGGALPLRSRLRVLVALYPFLGTSFGVLTSAVLVLVAALVGVDVAMVVYHVREHGLSIREDSGGLLGVVLGALGAGCAACGSVLLAGVLSLFGASGLLLSLPFDGLEFAASALLPLVLSMYWIAEGLRGGEINGCPVDIGRR